MAASPAVSARRGWLASRWARLDGPQRLAGIDLARGLAVVGMLAAHLIVTAPDFVWSDDATWLTVVNGRSSILFATLAGVSIGLVSGGRTPFAGAELRTVRLRLLVRAVLLWTIGVVLIATGVPVYVILPAYAILFLIAIGLVQLGARTLTLVAVASALVMPFLQPLLNALPLWAGTTGSDLSLLLGWEYPFTVWIAFLAAGLALARWGVRSLAVQLWTLAIGGVLAVVGYSLDALSRPPEGTGYASELWTAAPHSSGLLEVVGSGGFALAVAAACLLLCRTPVRWLAVPLRAVGAMPLTAYAAQLAVWALLASAALDSVGDLAGFRALDPFWPFVGWTIVLCTAWALLVGRGPLEAAVDTVARLAAPGRR